MGSWGRSSVSGAMTGRDVQSKKLRTLRTVMVWDGPILGGLLCSSGQARRRNQKAAQPRRSDSRTKRRDCGGATQWGQFGVMCKANKNVEVRKAEGWVV